MGKALIKGTLLGAIILFIWTALSWMVLPWHCNTLKKYTDEKSVAAIIKTNTTESGIYVLPHMCDSTMSKEEHMQASAKGPLVFSVIRRDGYNFSSPKPYIGAFVIYLVGAFFVTYLLLQTRDSTYLNRVWFVTVFGIAAGILAVFPNWNWWGFSLDYTLVGFLDFVIGWFLAGLALAAVTKRA